MAANDQDKLLNALGEIAIPGLDLKLADSGATIAAEGEGDDWRLRVTLGFPAAGIAVELGQALRRRAAELIGREPELSLDWRIRAHAVQGTLKPLPGVRNILAVASGKGGVGKSTTAVNLALALAAEGAAVGVLDADIYGPSQPTMLGLEDQRPQSRDGKTFEPLEQYGLKVMSIGFLVDRDQAMIWRGPMVTQALQQLMFQTNWGELDYLVVDLPPGTGDAQLTLTQKIPVSGALIVTTPQDIALMDARRGLVMFEKVGVQVLGIIENMASFVCPGCGQETFLFGEGGGAALSAESEVPLLGQLPLDLKIRLQADSGRPTVVAEP
ncbi:MAG: iron-sulfur cluster carrier protein ApbC, partial [Gammaproteobacteria bacterium]